MRMSKHNLFIIYLELRKALRGCQSHCFHVGWQRKAMERVPVLLRSHAPMVACSHFLHWISPLLCLAMRKCCDPKENLYCTSHRLRTSQRKPSQDQLSLKEKNVVVVVVKREMWAPGDVRSVQVVGYECIQAFVEMFNTALWKNI